MKQQNTFPVFHFELTKAFLNWQLFAQINVGSES